MPAFRNLHCFEKYNTFVWAITSNIKIKAILSASSVWGSLVKSYPLVALSSPTELRVCCVGPLRLRHINNAFKSNIKIKATWSVSSVWSSLVKSPCCSELLMVDIQVSETCTHWRYFGFMFAVHCMSSACNFHQNIIIYFPWKHVDTDYQTL